MSYDNRAYPVTLTGHSFASADKTLVLKPRSGAKWGYVDVIVSPTTTFAGASTTPKIQIGKTGALTQILNWDMSTAAAGTGIRASTDASAASFGTAPYWLATDEALVITLKAATGGGAAGVADIVILAREDA